MLKRFSCLALGCLALISAARAEAFCGFYVSGADAKLYNNATQVVLLRDGTRTVLSMQNNYQGPPENFAMVVPVPVVLQKKIDRFSRDIVFTLKAVREIIKRGVRFLSLAERFDASTPEGETHLEGKPLFGYVRAQGENPGEKTRRLAIDPEKAAMVR